MSLLPWAMAWYSTASLAQRESPQNLGCQSLVAHSVSSVPLSLRREWLTNSTFAQACHLQLGMCLRALSIQHVGLTEHG